MGTYSISCVSCRWEREHGSLNDLAIGSRVKGTPCEGCGQSDQYTVDRAL